jgi:hypothetical protein
MQKMMRRPVVLVNDKMQRNYRYELTQPEGRDFDAEFRPDLSPPQLLRLGIFGGKYMTVVATNSRRSGSSAPGSHPTEGILPSTSSASMPASRSPSGVRKAGFTPTIREAGSSGTAATTGAVASQIKRWKAMRRHVRQIERNCERGDTFCRTRQRQAVLHWAYDGRLL